MSKIKSTANISININLELTEEEARALDAIVGYGIQPFLDTFYKTLGKHYLQPNENGARSLFKTIKEELPKHFNKINEARKALAN